MNDLESLKVGDAVALVRRSKWKGRIPTHIGSVEKITKTQVTAFDGRRFRKKDGKEIGEAYSDFYYAPRLVPLTDGLKAKLEHNAAIEMAERELHDFAQTMLITYDEAALQLWRKVKQIAELTKD